MLRGARLAGNWQWALSIAAGLCLAAAQEPLGLWPGLIAGLAIALILARRTPDQRRAAWTGWWIGTAYFAASLAWIVEPFLVDAAAHAWMAPFALILMSGGLALFWAAAFWGTAKLGTPWALLALWPLAEYARSHLFTGFPWGLMSYGWLDTPLAQLAAFIGPHGLSAITLALIALPILWRPAQGTLTAALCTLGLVTLGLSHINTAPAQGTSAPIIRLTQPNAPQHQKWDRAFMPVFFRRQIAATSALPKPDLIVWPETSLPNWLNHADATLGTITDAAAGVPLIIGAQRFDGPNAYNSLVSLSASGAIQQIYDKHHLVPFGEYMPFAPLLSRLGLGLLTEQIGGFAPGTGPELVDLGALGTALPLICYEASFPHQLTLPGDARADFLLHITNDAWFGTWSGPYQHLAQARFRAIEQGLPLLRSANTGISAAIDSRGQILHSIPLGTSGHIDAALPAPGKITPYARIGDFPVLAFLALILCATLLTKRYRKD
jgi:apolipoprotein N-acyltransferase